MSRKVITTKDNSKTLLITSNDDTYHSIHGALTESNHVFINAGLKTIRPTSKVKIFEMGFGTGLNCILTLQHGTKHNLNIEYHSVEKFPITSDEIEALDYESLLKPELQPYFKIIHDINWGALEKINNQFSLCKINDDMMHSELNDNFFDLIYFDAFGPKSQPELWKPIILSKMYHGLKPGGLFITYCAQGQFKRDLKSVGFEVRNLPGPPGKREITQGIKPLI